MSGRYWRLVVRRCVVVSGPIDQSPAPETWDQTQTAQEVTDRTLRLSDRHHHSPGPVLNIITPRPVCPGLPSTAAQPGTRKASGSFSVRFKYPPNLQLYPGPRQYSYLLLTSSLSHHHLLIREGRQNNSILLIRPCMFWLQQRQRRLQRRKKWSVLKSLGRNKKHKEMGFHSIFKI